MLFATAFSTEWGLFREQIPDVNQRFEPAIMIRDKNYPFWLQGKLNDKVDQVEVVAQSKESSLTLHEKQAGDQNLDLKPTKSEYGELLVGKFKNDEAVEIPLPAPTGKFKMYFDENEIEDLWIAITYGVNLQ